MSMNFLFSGVNCFHSRCASGVGLLKHNRKKWGVYFLVAICVILLFVGVYFGVTANDGPAAKKSRISIDCTKDFQKYKAGVVTNGYECAQIGSEILQRGGSVADAAIASLFCEGIAQPQSMGLGGGFLLTIYTRETGVVETLDAREVAPGNAHINMYKGNATLAKEGGLAVAVPGELRGYWELHQKYGKMEWKELIQPTIDLCKKGNFVTPYLAKVLKLNQAVILKEPSLREIFIDPATNETWKVNQRIKRLKLAETLELIAEHGADVLYNGLLTKAFVDDIAESGGIITEEDMNNYKPKWDKPVIAKLFDNLTLFSSPLPGSGVILSFILNILNGYLDKTDDFSVKNWQRIVESFKFGYGRRTELGDIDGLQELIANLTSQTYALGIRDKIFDNKTFQDPEYYGANYSIPEDHGTAHISIIAPNGDAVSVTSTINLILGAKVRSKSTGIILNDEMDDFSFPNITNAFDIPPSPANYIEPGKRPLSSMCPTIVVDHNGDVRLVIGAAGGTKITTSTALVTLRNTLFNKSLNDSIIEKRLHHQLFPMAILYEEDFNESVVEKLTKYGHKSKFVSTKDGFAAVTAISRQCDTLFGHYDIRRQGSVSLF